MSDNRGPTITANRLAMSKALGAAFLNHQVEQLEQKVSGGGRGRGGGRREEKRHNGPRQTHGQGNLDPARDWSGGQRRGGAPPGGPKTQKRHTSAPDSESDDKAQRGWREDGKLQNQKDADIVVVDASVLVHGISHLKKWCRDGRQEIIIIPLEALNTLDLLKKGTSALAQRARAASRILEAQVGTNPRIRVQRDDAFVLWDSIPFRGTLPSPASSPEWVRRTICCARWELEHAMLDTPEKDAESDIKAKAERKPSVVLAVLSPAGTDAQETTGTQAVSASPVPLPAPQLNKFEPRSAGSLVLQWATKAELPVLEVSPSPTNGSPGVGGAKEGGRRSGDYGRRSPEDDRTGKAPVNFGRGRRNSQHSQNKDGRIAGSGGLVERPPAVMAMMEAVSQPSRVVRVLARGEKLDPN